MVKFRVPDELRYDMPTHFALAQRIAKDISDTFPGCIELEFEKCYMPYCVSSAATRSVSQLKQPLTKITDRYPMHSSIVKSGTPV